MPIYSYLGSGVEIPIHPIDTVQAVSDGNGGVICVAGFDVSTTNPGVAGELQLRRPLWI